MSEAVLLTSTYLYDLFINSFSSYPIYLKICLLLMLLCITGIIEIILYITIKRIVQHFKKKRNLDVKDSVTTMLANALVFSDNDDPQTVVKHFLPRFSKIPLYRNFVKKLLVSEILNNHSSFSGRSAEILREIYLQLNLDKAARKDLKSWYRYKKIAAIKELTEMLVKDECPTFLSYTNSSNSDLRLEAQRAHIRLCSDNPFQFLDTIRRPISEYHQIILFELITKMETMARPKFSNWLNSENESVVAFSLKLIDHYQQFNAIPNLIYLINHYDLKIRASAIEILGSMEAEMAEPHLVDAYSHQPKQIKVVILVALGKIASGANLTFLYNEAQSKDISIKIAAVRAIRAHRKTGEDLLNTMFAEGNRDDMAIVKQVLDERIKV